MAVNKFGRLVAPKDGRDFRFLMRTAAPQIHATIGKPKPRSHAYRDGPLLDQGDTPQCVGYSTRGFLDGAPLMLKADRDPSAPGIYRGAQANDEWPGENYDGTSVRGAMKFLASLGHIKSYVWGQTVEEAIAWMNGGYGTCVIGSNWYAEMSDVDREGFLREPAASLATPIGGHAFRLIWFDAKKQGVLMRNSWGHDFGFPDPKTGVPTGYAYLRPTFLARLLKEDGEIAAPVQIKLKAVTPT
jgi:hypothetical protein